MCSNDNDKWAIIESDNYYEKKRNYEKNYLCCDKKQKYERNTCRDYCKKKCKYTNNCNIIPVNSCPNIEQLILSGYFDFLKPIFIMPDTYMDVELPFNLIRKLYKISELESMGNFLYPSGETCNYFMWSQVLGTNNDSIVNLIDNDNPTDIWLTSPEYTYKITWILEAFGDIIEDPLLRVILKDSFDILHEIVDAYGKKIVLDYPKVKGATTNGIFYLNGWNNIILIQCLFPGLTMKLNIEAIPPWDPLLNPYILGVYNSNVCGELVPVYEISDDENLPGNYLRIVREPFVAFSKKVRAEFLENVHLACIEIPSVQTQITASEPFTFNIQADTRQLKSSEILCKSIIILVVYLVSILVAVIVPQATPLIYLSIADKLRALFTLILIGTVNALELPAILPITIIDTINKDKNSLVSSDLLYTGITEFSPSSSKPNYCLACGVSLYVDCAFLIPNGASEFITPYLKLDPDGRTFYLIQAASYSVNIELGINFNRLHPDYYIKDTYCPSRPYFSMEVLFAGTRRYLDTESTSINPDPVRNGKAVSYLTYHKQGPNDPAPEYDFTLSAKYVIKHDPGYETSPLTFTLRNGAVLLSKISDPDNYYAISMNPTSRLYHVVAGNTLQESSVQILGKSFIKITISQL